MNFGRALLVFSTIAAMMGGSGSVLGQGEELGAQKLQYDVKRAELVQPIRELQKNYQSQLEKLRDQVRAGGSLEKTKAVDAEIKGFRDGTAPPAEDGFPDLRRLQRIYANELTARHTTALRDLPAVVKGHKADLEALQKKLIQQNNLEEAEKVKEALSKIDETLGIKLPIRPSSGRPTNFAVIETTDPARPLQKGAVIFTNRDFVRGTIPDKFQQSRSPCRSAGARQQLDSKSKLPVSSTPLSAPGWKISSRTMAGRE